MTAKCQAGAILDTGKTGPRYTCKERPVEDRMYCAQHLAEAMQRVRVVSPPDTIRGRAIPELERSA